MGALMRELDWTETPFGAPGRWSGSLQQMARLLLATPQPAALFWTERHACLYNDAFRPTFGQDAHHPSILGRPGASLRPETWEVIGPPIEKVGRGDGTSWHEDQRIPVMRDGRPVDTFWTCSYAPIVDMSSPQGIGGVLVLGIETTEQVMGRHHLRAEHARLATMFDQAPMGLALLSGPEHRIERANTRLLELVGSRPVLGLPLEAALPETVAQGHLQRLDRMLRSGLPYAASAARVTLAPDRGKPLGERHLDLVYQPLIEPNGSVGGILMHGADVTERHEHEMAQRRREERLRIAVESTGLGTFDIALASGTIHLSENALALFGLSGRTPTLDELAERVQAEDRELLQATLHDALAGPGGGFHRLKLRIRAGPNDLRHLSVAGTIDAGHAADADPRATGIVWDMTEHQTLVDTLRTADQRKDEFLATLAHELRNPLAALRSASYLIGRPGVGPERIRWCGEVIQRQSRAMALLLDDLMEVSRITRGKVELKRQPVELQAVVEAALETARPFLDAAGHRLATDLPPSPVAFHADPLRVAQVLSNLLSNAVRYSPPGSTIRLSGSADEHEVRIEIADDGIGIAPERLPTLFEMFHRSQAADAGSTGGLGVGLAVSKGLVDLHGGRLEAHSAGLGRGSSFMVTLPRSEVAAVLHPATGSQPVPPAPTAPRILVADDNVDAAEAIAMLLRMEGYQVDVVHDGLAALEAAREQPPFAAFLDIGMPGIDGYQLATRIRRHPWGERPFLVAVTGWGQGADRDRALAAGFDIHLTKPIDLDSVAELLARRREAPNSEPNRSFD